jgi:lysophospholipase L1-like esterase
LKIAFYGDSLTVGLPGASYVDVLRRRLSGHTMLRYGRINETAPSLYRYVVKRKLLEPVDITVLWVGTNDVAMPQSWAAAALKRIMGQPRARDPEAFGDRYRALLDLLSSQTRRIVAVSPMCIGEDINTPWNNALAEISAVIQSLSSAYAHVTFVDLRAEFIGALGAKPAARYLSPSVTRVVLDGLLRSKAQVDRMAAARGLYFTLDGVHLNSAGAELVANALVGAIGDMIQGPSVNAK